VREARFLCKFCGPQVENTPRLRAACATNTVALGAVRPKRDTKTAIGTFDGPKVAQKTRIVPLAKSVR